MNGTDVLGSRKDRVRLLPVADLRAMETRHGCILRVRVTVEFNTSGRCRNTLLYDCSAGARMLELHGGGAFLAACLQSVATFAVAVCLMHLSSIKVPSYQCSLELSELRRRVP